MAENLDAGAALDGRRRSPSLLLKAAAVDHNIATMARYCRDNDVLLAPHTKSTLCPYIVQRQRSAGAWALTGATVGQLRDLRALGASRLVLANELADPGAIAWLADELVRDPRFELLVWVDTPDSVDFLSEHLPRGARDGGGLKAMLEVGLPNGRTGARTLDQAMQTARAARDAGIIIAGVSGYEGIAPSVAGAGGSDNSAGTVAAVESFLDLVARVAVTARDAGLIDAAQPLVSAGGSAFFDIVVTRLARPLAAQGFRTVIRPGCYVAHDDGLYAALSPFSRPGSAYTLRPAVEVWSRVVSTPEPGLAVFDLGRRHASHDNGDPVALRRLCDGRITSVRGARTVRLSDQHTVVRMDAPARIGDWFGFGISHPCTTFDKWREALVVDEDYLVRGTAEIGVT